MFTNRLRRVSYGWLALQGLVATLAPKRSIDLKLKLLGLGVEHAEDLEPKDWYVRAMRAAGIGMVAAGIAGLGMERRAASVDEPARHEAPPREDE